MCHLHTCNLRCTDIVHFKVGSLCDTGWTRSLTCDHSISRTLLFGGPKGLQYDDWIMGIFVTTCYTVLIVLLNLEASSNSNLLPPGFDISTLTPQNIADREYGSKMVIIVEQMYICLIWACKACLLILYHRLTHMVAVKENIAVKILAVYIALGFVVMEILYFSTWCRPFARYWAVPTESSCNTLTNHRITNAVFNGYYSPGTYMKTSRDLWFRSQGCLHNRASLYMSIAC
jgi:hypothetical protein